MTKKHIRILSINGGGIRGYIPALIIDELSKQSGQDITQLFDMVIGTSIGGMLSAAYTTPMDLHNHALGPKYNTSEVLNLMLRSRNEIFPQDSIRNQLVTAKYPREGLDNFLTNEFTINGQPALLKDTMLPIAVTALNEKNNDPQIWSSCSKFFSNYSLADAVGATTAAPTYFAPKEVKVHTNLPSSECANYGMIQKLDGCYYRLIDGGLFANSPAMLALQMIRNRISGKTIEECDAQYSMFQNPSVPWKDFDLKVDFVNHSFALPNLSLNNETYLTIIEIGTGKFNTKPLLPDLSKINNLLDGRNSCYWLCWLWHYCSWFILPYR